MLFREGSGEWGEEQWEKLCQALPASSKQPQMKSPSVGEDSPHLHPPPVPMETQNEFRRENAW